MKPESSKSRQSVSHEIAPEQPAQGRRSRRSNSVKSTLQSVKAASPKLTTLNSDSGPEESVIQESRSNQSPTQAEAIRKALTQDQESGYSAELPQEQPARRPPLVSPFVELRADMDVMRHEIEELIGNKIAELSSKIQPMVQDVIKLQQQSKSIDDSSSEDSAYQAALELGSDYYGKGLSERARHRNFRKCKSIDSS